MELSVIVPAYDIERYLDRCLQGLRDQAMGPQEYEIIVIDDGSTDGTNRIARAHEGPDPRVTVYRQSNRGLSAARNAGLAHATGKYVYFVDGDDRVVPGSLPSVVNAMREHSLDVAFVGWRRVEPDEVMTERSSGPGPARVSGIVNGIDFLTTSLEYPSSVWSSLFSRALLDRTGIRFEVGRFFEDQLFVAEVLAAASRVGTVNVDVYRYTVRQGSITRSVDAAHTRRLCDDLEHVVAGLGELQARTIATGTATPAFLDRVRTMQEGYVFLLLVRLVRSSIPLGPALADTIARLESGGYYPLTRFPGTDRNHRGLRYRIMTPIINRRRLLSLLARGYRATVAVRERMGRA